MFRGADIWASMLLDSTCGLKFNSFQSPFLFLRSCTVLPRHSAEFNQSPAQAGRYVISSSNRSISVPSNSIARKLRNLSVALFSRTELVLSDGFLRRLCEISWSSQCWALVERNKCQHPKSTSTTVVPGSRRNGSVGTTDTCSFWLWQRWGLRRQRAMTVFVVWLLWPISILRSRRTAPSWSQKKGGEELLWSSVFPSLHLP